MPRCFFASDLHGQLSRYQKLWTAIAAERPEALFLGGDLLPHWLAPRSRDQDQHDFVQGYLAVQLRKLAEVMGSAYPRIFMILGNDDPRIFEESVNEGARVGLWDYMHQRKAVFGSYHVYGYAHVPPTPFALKDWERYDVSRYVDPGCLPPEEGRLSVPVSDRELLHTTIAQELADLTGDEDLTRAIFLFHAPPYRSKLDRAALDGKMVDHVPLDIHVGSIAIERFLRSRRPLVSLHGHIHESARLTGSWRELIGRCQAFSAAHDGPELALVRFDPDQPAAASRELL